VGQIARTPVPGLTDRGFEAAGIPTVAFGVQAFKSRLLPMSIPRLVLTPELMGKTLGRPGEKDTQLAYLDAGLELLENTTGGGTWIEIGK